MQEKENDEIKKNLNNDVEGCKNTTLIRKIFLSKNITEQWTLSDSGFLAYVSLRAKWYSVGWHYRTDIIFYEELLWILFGNTTYTKYDMQKLKEGIYELEKLGLISITEQNKKYAIIEFQDKYYFSVAKQDEESSGNEIFPFQPYTIVRMDEVHCIMNLSEKYKEKVLRYFVAKIGSIYHGAPIDVMNGTGFGTGNNVGAVSQEYCCNIANIGIKAGIHYDKVFEENELLVILRSRGKIVDSETKMIINGFSNCYSRPEDIKDLIWYYEQREKRNNMTNNVVKITKDANRKRSNKQSYNAYIKGKNVDYNKVLDYLKNEISNYEKICKTQKKQRIEYHDTQDELERLTAKLNEIYWELF